MRYRLGPMHVISIVLAAYLALAGCASTGTAAPTGTQPPQPQVTDTATVAPSETLAPTATSSPTITTTPTKSQTKTPRPTDTATPTATSYPEPAVPLSSAGPWLIFKADEYLWAMNQDGTGLTRLTNERICTFAVRPNSTVQSGLDIAYATSLDGQCQSTPWESHPGSLKILSGPERNVTTLVYNLSQGVKGMDWSPSGSKLAFVGAMDDTSTNMFVYDFATAQATRIAVTEENDYIIGWSSDERYVIHETSVFGFMGYSATLGVWSSRADASGVTQLVGTLENQWIDNVNLVGWQSPTEMIVTLDQWVSGENVSNTDVRIINIETGSYTTPIREPVLDMAYSPKHNLFLTTKEIAPPPNRLLVFHHNGDRREISGYTIKEVRWLSAYDAFLGQTPDGRTYLISPDGTVVEIPTPKWDTYDSRFINSHSVIVSPNDQWWAWFHSRWTTASSASELWVGPAKAQPPVRLSTSLGPDSSKPIRVYDIMWSPDSQYLLWRSSQDIYVAKAPEFEISQIGSTLAAMSPVQGWRWSPDSQYLLLFSEQGIFVASPPDFRPVQVAQIVGSGWGIWVK